jgi:hypothetical protein
MCRVENLPEELKTKCKPLKRDLAVGIGIDFIKWDLVCHRYKNKTTRTFEHR